MGNFMGMMQGSTGALFQGGLFIIMMIWSLVWKGWSLWLASRRGEKVWFVILLIVNTFGILDIIYIFGIAKKSDKVLVVPKKEANTEHQM